VPCDRSPASIADGDVDGDSRPDIAVLAAADDDLWLEQGGTSAPRAGRPVPRRELRRRADLDGDGRAESRLQQRRRKPIALVARRIRRPQRRPRTLGASGSRPRSSIEGRPGIRSWRCQANEVGVATVLHDRTGGGIRWRDARSGPATDRARWRCCVERAVSCGSLSPTAAASPAASPCYATWSQAGEFRLEHPTALAMDKFRSRSLPRISTATVARTSRCWDESGGESQGWVVPWIAGADGGWRALEADADRWATARIAACDLDGDGKSESW
jgi:hypothetical protein